MLRRFRDDMDRARYMEAEKIAVDIATALLIQEPGEGEAVRDGSGRECLDDTDSSKG